MTSQNSSSVFRLTRDTLALVLAGGRGSRLFELTRWRAKPAVFFGGKFRITDFPLSNCVNSGIRRISVLTQYKAHSLIRHLVRGWSSFGSELGEFVEVLPASQRRSDAWYTGTADAVYQNIDIIRSMNPKYVLILSGDHIYKMDYGNLLMAHVESGAPMTVSCIEVSLEEARGFGVMSVDENSRVTSFVEKPENPQPMPGSDSMTLASMGNYVFDTEYLFKVLEEDAATPLSSRDFGKDIIPRILDQDGINAFPFRNPEDGSRPYWRDVGTLDAFWEANMGLVDVVPDLNLYDDEWPILTYQQQLPSAKFVLQGPGREGKALDSIVSGGCIVSGALLNRSLLFSKVKIHSYARVEESVILPDVDVGRHCQIRRAIVDRGCHLPPGTVIGENPEDDAERFRLTENGIVLVTPEMLGQRTHVGI